MLMGQPERAATLLVNLTPLPSVSAPDHNALKKIEVMLPHSWILEEQPRTFPQVVLKASPTLEQIW